MVTIVVTLLGHDWPLPAIVAAFGPDERTVVAWQARVGPHCQAVQAPLLEQGRLDLGHVQADEL